MDSNELIKAYGGILPSRGELRKAALFGATEEQRQIANQLLKLMPRVDPNKPVEWEDSPWNPRNQPTLEEMQFSPTGRLTLKMLNNSSLPKEIQAKADDPAGVLTPVGEPVAAEAPSTPEVEPVNEHLAALNWPPKPKAPEDDGQPHRWQAARPSTSSRDQTPLADSDLDSNKPIY
jgi:hypothetical protein